MTDESSKQITIRFTLSDWVQILREAQDDGIKPVQYIRSTVLKRLSGTLVDVKSIDAYIRQREKDNVVSVRRSELFISSVSQI